MASFAPVKVVDNAEGWGPTDGLDLHDVGLNLDIPLLDFDMANLYSFSTGRVGRVCDFTLSGQKWQEQRAAKGKGKKGKGKGKNDENVEKSKDDEGFALVDNRPVSSKTVGRGRGAGGKGKGKGKVAANYQEGILGQKPKSGYAANAQRAKAKSKGKGKNLQNRTVKEWSFEAPNSKEWEIMRDIPLPALGKLQVNAKEVKYQDILWCGKLHYYNKEYDKVTIKAEKPVRRFEDVLFFNVLAADDPIFPDCLGEDPDINVIATHEVLACLMAAARSVYSWDINVTKKGGKLAFDKRYDSQIEYLTVNETARDPPQTDSPDNMNSPLRLGQEATCLNQNFSQMVLDQNRVPQEMEQKNPFEEENEQPSASGAVRYRKVTLPGNPKDENEFNKNPVHILIRSEVNCKNPDVKDSYISLKALNEFDPKLNYSWRSSLESQRGAVFATELKNNAFKLGRWAASAMLSGCDLMKIGYASRVRQNDPWAHTVLSVQTYQTDSFTEQIGMTRNNAFGILRNIIDILASYPDGKYLVMRNPTETSLRIYSVPHDTFEEPEEEEEEEEEDVGELDDDGNLVPDSAH